ncbi:hypothetical protein Bca4012_088053 [Brassica carinata]
MIPARNSASRSHEVNNVRSKEAFARFLEQRERGSPRSYTSSKAPATSMCHTPPESPVSNAKMRSGGAVAGVLKYFKAQKKISPVQEERYHRFRMLHNRLIQLRFINARAEASILKVNVEAFKNCEALSKLTRKLHALSVRVPLLHGATVVDVVSIHEEMVGAIEVMDEIEDIVIKFLPRIGQRRPKTEPKASSVEVAFQPNFSSLAIKSFGVPKEDDKQSSDVNPSSSATTVSSAAILPVVSSPPARKDVEEIHTCVTRIEQDYVEPWDQNSYYPTVLPLRKPNSGDPELLDQEEFGNVAKHLHYDENSINSAEELGLTSGQHCKKQMLFFKIPDCLPVTKQPTAKRSVSERSSPFECLPEGFMGKMLVYKSGTVKLKLGDVLYDVSPGPNTVFHNDVAAINGKERNCCRIGSSAKFATVTPDVESLLNSDPDMQIHK